MRERVAAAAAGPRQLSRFGVQCYASIVVSRRTMRAAAAACGVALLASPPARAAPTEPAPAPASDPMVEAQALFDAGSEAYNLGNFAVAIEKFEAAYSLSRATSLLYNLGQAYSKRHEVDPDPAYLRKAKVLFENFAKISEAAGEDPRDARARAEAIAAQLQALGVEEPAPAAEGPVPPPPAPAPAPAPYRPGPAGVAGFSLLGVGLLSGTGLAVTGFVSASRLSAQRDRESTLVPLPLARAEQYDANLGKARALAWAGVGVGAGLVVLGAVLVAVDAARGRKSSTRARLGPGGLELAF